MLRIQIERVLLRLSVTEMSYEYYHTNDFNFIYIQFEMLEVLWIVIILIYIFPSSTIHFIDQMENAQHLMTISLFQPWSFTSVQSPQSARSQWWIGGEYSVYRIPPWTCLSIGVAHWDVHHRWNRLSWSNRHDHDRFPACTLMLEVLVPCRTTESIVPLWPATKFMKKKKINQMNNKKSNQSCSWRQQWTYSIHQDISSPFDFHHGNTFLIDITMEFLDNGCVRAQHTSDEQYIDFAIFQW